MPLGDWIKAKRHETRMTLEELASRIGVTASTVHRFEQDINEPDLETSVRLFYVFNEIPPHISKVLALRGGIEQLKPLERDAQLLTQDDLAILLGTLLNPPFWHSMQPHQHDLLWFLDESFRELFVAHNPVEGTPISFRAFWFPSKMFDARLNHPGLKIRLEPREFLPLIHYIAEGGGALTMDDAGLYVRAVREMEGMKQADLHERMRGLLSRSTLSTLERGTIGSLGLLQAVQLAHALGHPSQIFSALWRAAEIRVMAGDDSAGDPRIRLTLAEAVITLWRWYQIAPGPLPSWEGEKATYDLAAWWVWELREYLPHRDLSD